MSSPTIYRYRNPWHDGLKYGPEFFEARVAPTEYRGFQIFKRFSKSYELVKDGVCLTIRGGAGGPRSLVDALYGEANDEPAWRIERARSIAAKHGVALPRIAHRKTATA